MLAVISLGKRWQHVSITITATRKFPKLWNGRKVSRAEQTKCTSFSTTTILITRHALRCACEKRSANWPPNRHRQPNYFRLDSRLCSKLPQVMAHDCPSRWCD